MKHRIGIFIDTFRSAESEQVKEEAEKESESRRLKEHVKLAHVRSSEEHPGLTQITIDETYGKYFMFINIFPIDVWCFQGALGPQASIVTYGL